MLITVVLAALALGPELAVPGWAATAAFILQVGLCHPRTRWLRGPWTLMAQAALFPWAGLPGFLAGSVLLVVPGRSRWALFACVVAAAALSDTTSVYACANAIGNTISQGLVIFLLTRLGEVRAELHATRGLLAAESVRVERERVGDQLETSIGDALTGIIRCAGRHDMAGVIALARRAARSARESPPPTAVPEVAPTDLTPRLVLPIMVAVHAVYLVVAALFVIGQEPGGPALAVHLPLLAVVVGLHLHHSTPRPPVSRPRFAAWTLTAEVALACVPLFTPGMPYSQLVGLAAGAVLTLARGWWSWLIAAAAVLAVPTTLAARGVATADVLILTLDVVAMTVIFYGIAITTRLVHQVHETRRQLAEIAVLRERNRIAKDVHDLLGYGLSAILVTAEPAARTGAPGDRRFEEIAGIARRSLGDLRAIPGGSTEISLDGELRSAGDVLSAAGTTPRLDLGHGTLPQRTDEVLARVVREAVNNVLRHSRARACTLETGRGEGTVWLRVANDRGNDRGEALPATGGRGQGIPNLTERIGAWGGTVTAAPADDGFELLVRLPAGAPDR
ncbi:two-component system sensor histidine kinase DesK [Murinocardiopsis flavida]|uniref:Two-component system sensor histidine kinase DesK n=1 Tax=Murinocardiopsis flavida TaxID=645275 RepID=A0A2P8DUF8_9ACTN|nr:histidine kinase [Murinocardiopsis flavida]PSL00857.1 two-component system sensor histidine kinase DesK [Murinocardiopsis flavida]